MTLIALLFSLASAQAPSTSAFFRPTETGVDNRTTLHLQLSADGPTTDLQWTTLLPDGLVAADPFRLETTCMGMVSLDGQTLTHTIDRLSEPCETELDLTSASQAEYELSPGLPTSSQGGSEGVSVAVEFLHSLPTVGLTATPSVAALDAVRSLYGTISSTSARTSFFINVVYPDNVVFPEAATVELLCSDSLIPPVATISEDRHSASVNAFATPGNCELHASAVLLDVGVGLPQMTLTLGRDTATAVARIETPTRLASTAVQSGAAGETVNVELTLRNRDRSETLTDLSTHFDLNTLLPGLTATEWPADGTCGASSSVSGTDVLQISGVSIPPASDCVLTAQLTLPATASEGSFYGQSAPISLTMGDTPTTWEPALIAVNVVSNVRSSLTLEPSPVGAGQAGTLTLEIDNQGAQIDNYVIRTDQGAWIPGLTLGTDPITSCTDNTTAAQGESGQSTYIDIRVPQVPAGQVCTVTVPVDVAPDTSHGAHHTRSLAPTGDVGGIARAFPSAVATGAVVGAPEFSVRITPSQVDASGTTQAVFTASLSEENGLDGTDVAFDITADDALVTGVPEISATCGAGASLTSEPLGVTGASLTAGEPCTVTVPLTVATDAGPITAAVHSSGLFATVDGVATRANAVSASATVSAGDFTVTTATPAVVAGSTMVFSLSVTNVTDQPSTGNTYLARMSDALPGATLVSSALGSGCGSAAFVASESSSLAILTSIDIAPGEACVIDLTVEIPDLDTGEYAFSPGSFPLVTSSGTEALFAVPARFNVVVPLSLSASFTPDVLEPGQSTILRYELATYGIEAEADIAFAHELGSVLGGLVATNTPLTDPCGPGSTLSGTDTLTLSGGTLDAEDSCTVEVEVQAPAAVPFDGVLVLPTSVVTSTRGTSAETTPGAEPTLAFVPQNCRSGFDNVQGLCVDIDECSDGSANCDALASCTNTEGSFECACASGYEGDGFTCSDVDECALDACAENAQCTNTDGSFDCVCDEGFDGDPMIRCAPICGDGLVRDEDCDDGNLDLGDGCDDDCVVEPGFACAGEPSECEETCGDGVVDRLEECDDGDDNGPDADCLDDCTLPEELDTDDTGTDGSGCSCASAPNGAPWAFVGLAILGFAARRRRSERT